MNEIRELWLKSGHSHLTHTTTLISGFGGLFVGRRPQKLVCVVVQRNLLAEILS